MEVKINLIHERHAAHINQINLGRTAFGQMKKQVSKPTDESATAVRHRAERNRFTPLSEKSLAILEFTIKT